MKKAKVVTAKNMDGTVERVMEQSFLGAARHKRLDRRLRALDKYRAGLRLNDPAHFRLERERKMLAAEMRALSGDP